MTNLKVDEHEQFYEQFHSRRRRTARRLQVTEWDSLDSVSHALLDVIEAQNDIAQAQRDQQEEREDGTFATCADEAAAVEARAQAVQRLCSALALEEKDKWRAPVEVHPEKATK